MWTQELLGGDPELDLVLYPFRVSASASASALVALTPALPCTGPDVSEVSSMGLCTLPFPVLPTRISHDPCQPE